jgi:hypothetical protein
MSCAADFGALTVADLAVVEGFVSATDLSSIDWDATRQVIAQQGLLFPEVDQIISAWESGDFTLWFQGLGEMRAIVNSYPGDMQLSDVFCGQFFSPLGDAVFAPPPEVAWDPVPSGQGFVSPTYDYDVMSNWSIPSLQDTGIDPAWISGEGRQLLFDHIAATGWSAVGEVVDDLGVRLGIPDLVDTVNNAIEVRDMLTNFHGNLLTLLDDGINDRVSIDEYDSRFNDVLGHFFEDAGEFLSDQAAGALSSLPIKIETGNSFTVSFLEAGSPITGGAKNDAIVGSVLPDSIHLGAGDDVGMGRGGDDLLAAGAGNDWLFGNRGADTLVGANGSDELRGGTGADVLLGNLGADTLRGGMGPDELRGGAFTDQLYGGADDDVLIGAAGADLLRGALGSDQILGGTEDDTLFGGQGGDLLRGGLGVDVLTGGPGADRFSFNASGGFNADTLTDFDASQGDRIELESIAFAALAGVVSPGSAIGASPHVQYDATTGELLYSEDGSGGDLQLIATLQGAPAFSAADAILV